MVRGLEKRGFGRALIVAAAISAFAGILAARAGATNVYVTNAGSNDVSVINSRTNTPLGPRIPVGTRPESIAISPNGRTAYVANRLSNDVSVIDLQTRSVEGMSIPVGRTPLSVAVSPDGRKAYVVNKEDKSVSVIDLQAKRVTGQFNVGTEPLRIAISRDGTTLYVTDKKGEAILVVNAQTGIVVAQIPVSGGPFAIAISPDGRLALVGRFLDGSLSVIDTATNEAVGPVIDLEMSNPDSIVFSPNGMAAYVAGLEEESVSVIDMQARRVIGVVNGGVASSFSEGVGITPDGSTVYLANEAADNVSVIDARTNRLGPGPIPVGDEPNSIAAAPFDLAPVASSASSSKSARVGAPIGFDGSPSYDADGTVAKYAWSFGDGSKVAEVPAATTKHGFTRAGTFKVGLTAIDDQGCSTAPLPSAAGCQGSPLAATSVSVKIVDSRVAVKCPHSAGPKGCKFTLQGVSSKRKPRAQTKLTKLKVKAGKSALAPIKPKPRYAKKFGTARKALISVTETVRGHTKTAIRRLLLR